MTKFCVLKINCLLLKAKLHASKDIEIKGDSCIGTAPLIKLVVLEKCKEPGAYL